jgi:hypothetical protein
MTVFAYHTPQIASPINDRRAGTSRVVSDTPTPIQVGKGYSVTLYFAFQDHNNKAFWIEGRTMTAHIHDRNNTKVAEVGVNPIPGIIGAGQIKLDTATTAPLLPGFYNLVITYIDDFGTEVAVQTMRSRPRFVLDVVDFVNT